jgi:hypothetical protein
MQLLPVKKLRWIKRIGSATDFAEFLGERIGTLLLGAACARRCPVFRHEMPC